MLVLFEYPHTSDDIGKIECVVMAQNLCPLGCLVRQDNGYWTFENGYKGMEIELGSSTTLEQGMVFIAGRFSNVELSPEDRIWHVSFTERQQRLRIT